MKYFFTCWLFSITACTNMCPTISPKQLEVTYGNGKKDTITVTQKPSLLSGGQLWIGCDLRANYISSIRYVQ